MKIFVLPFPALSPQVLLKSECKGRHFLRNHQTFCRLFSRKFQRPINTHYYTIGLMVEGLEETRCGKAPAQCHRLWCRSHKSPKGGLILLSAGNAGGIPVAQTPLSLAQPRIGLHSRLISIYLCNPFQGCVVVVVSLPTGARFGATRVRVGLTININGYQFLFDLHDFLPSGHKQ